MLFKVEMTVIPPAHLSEDEFNAIKLKEKNYEILQVSEPIDEMTLQNIQKFSDKETSQSLSEDEKKIYT